jgi:hypothetical protein
MLKTVIKHFEGRTDLPIEVNEIAQAIVELGCQDEIHFVPVEADPAQIHGLVAKFRYSLGVYADSIWVAHIPYNSNDSVEMQRVTCCKELVHLFDSDLEKTDTEEEVPALIERLLGPFSSDNIGLADLMAGKDKLALYMCLPLLLPKTALQHLRQEVREGRKDANSVAALACMPVELVTMMLADNWDTLNGALEAL